MSAAADVLRCVLVRVHGIVQGVGFREACVDAACAIGVAGWVRNRADGTVEALVCGAADRVDAMLRWLRQGPPSARVTEVDARALEPPGEPPARFERRPTH